MIPTSIFLISVLGAGVLGGFAVAMLASFKQEDDWFEGYKSGLAAGRKGK
jgi:hypothetical protein